MLSLGIALYLSASPCDLPAGVTLEAQLQQLLPKAALAPELTQVSPELLGLLQRAKALRTATVKKTMTTLKARVELLIDVTQLCGTQLLPRLAAARVLVALTNACVRDEDFFSVVYVAEAAGRTLTRLFPASPAAYQVFAAALDLIARGGATPERRFAAMRELTLTLENCRELDPAAHCTVP